MSLRDAVRVYLPQLCNMMRIRHYIVYPGVERECLIIYKLEFVRHGSHHVFRGDQVFYILVMIAFEFFEGEYFLWVLNIVST